MNEFINVNDRLPELPDEDYVSMIVIAACKNDGGNKWTVPLEYKRTLVHGKRVERWEYLWGRIFNHEVTHWMPLPEPPAD